MTAARFQRILLRHPYLFALLLLVVALGVNYALQPNLFEARVLNSNLRTFLPLILLAAGQAVVIIAGGIDLSVGAVVSLVAAVYVTRMAPDAPPQQIVTVILLGCAVGMAAGVLNGWAVAFLRLQPIVTTYATSFIFGGLALWVLPRPGGTMPQEFARWFRQATPLNLPMGVWVALAVLVAWLLLRQTRLGRYLFAVGGQPEAAYATGVPVNWVRFSTYVMAGLMAALAALALTLLTNSGDPRMGNDMTLRSVVAVVLGGTRLAGGQGGIAGSMAGALVLGIIRNIISFADVPTWWQTLVDALIIVLALAAPGLIRLVRRQVSL